MENETEIECKYDIIGANLGIKLLNEVIKWMYAKNVKETKVSTLATSMSAEIIEYIDNLVDNRSEFIRECCNSYLDALYKTFSNPIPMFSSKGAFLRSAIYFSILSPVKLKVIKIEQKQEHYVKYNGSFMSKNEFLGNFLIETGKEMIENDDCKHRNHSEVKTKNVKKTKKK